MLKRSTVFALIGSAAATIVLPLAAYAESSASNVAAGFSHTCAVKQDHTLWCWGSNDSGQLGDGTTTDRPLPVQVSALGAAVAEVSAGDLFTCARKTDHTLWCWGNNASGQLGNGTTADSLMPVQVTALGNTVAEVSAGDLFACARATDGTASCWGSGLLGDGTANPSLSPIAVTALGSGVAEISTGDGAACARKTDGTLWCWGNNTFGVVGDGTTTDRFTPTRVATLGNGVTGVSVGDVFACAVQGGGVWCWGTNDHGQLGDGTTTSHDLPAKVSGLPQPAASVSANGRHTCAGLGDGTLWCWGWNQQGELGDGTTAERRGPVAIGVLGTAVAQVSSGVNQDTCVGGTDGSVWCWGSDGFGQLGDGQTTSRATAFRVLQGAVPTSVPASSRWSQVWLVALLLPAGILGLRRRTRRSAASVLVAVAFMLAAGCTDVRAPVASAEPSGTIAIALQVPPIIQIDAITYQITRDTFSKSGSLDVSHTNAVTAVIGGLPSGSGYQLTMTATDPSQKLTGCAGTASFEVTGGAVTNVPVDIACHVAPVTAPPPPSVPIPFPAVALLSFALLGAGLAANGKRP